MSSYDAPAPPQILFSNNAEIITLFLARVRNHNHGKIVGQVLSSSVGRKAAANDKHTGQDELHGDDVVESQVQYGVYVILLFCHDLFECRECA